MAKSQLSPLEINSATGEPFLRLPAPHQNIIVTPPREGDDEHLFALFRDTNVADWFSSIPAPFSRDQSRAMLDQAKEVADAVLDELRTLEKESPGRELKVVDGCPVRHLREVQENGTDVFIGYIEVRRNVYKDVLDEIERRAQFEENNKRPIGDSTIRWGIAAALASSHQDRGIMTAVVDQLLHSWLIPRMNARLIVVFTWVRNQRSIRVFEKNGFAKIAVIEGRVVQGKERSLTVLEWRMQED